MTPEEKMQKKIERYRRMTPQQRLQVAFQMHDLTRVMARTHLCLNHPDWTARQIDDEVGRMFLRAGGVSEEVIAILKPAPSASEGKQ